MINKKFYIFVLFIILLSSFRVYAENIINKQSDEPIEITSNRMEAFNDKKMVVFSGNAKVVQGNIVLKSDQLILYYKNETGKKEKIGTIETNGAGDLEKIEAKGNVSLTQGKRMATGDEATFFRESNKVILTGHAVLNEERNSIKGERVIIYINENKGVVEGNTKAVIYPHDKKKTGTN